MIFLKGMIVYHHPDENVLERHVHISYRNSISRFVHCLSQLMLRNKHPFTIRCPVTRNDIQMKSIQTERTVVSYLNLTCCHLSLANTTLEGLIAMYWVFFELEHLPLGPIRFECIFSLKSLDSRPDCSLVFQKRLYVHHHTTQDFQAIFPIA